MAKLDDFDRGTSFMLKAMIWIAGFAMVCGAGTLLFAVILAIVSYL